MNKVFIIAEAGVNHNGNIDIAKKMIDEAKNSGADAVKFQTFKAQKLVSQYAQKAEYQKKDCKTNETQLQMLKKYELSEKNHKILIEYCKQKKIKFLSSPFDLESIELLNQLGIDIFKIPSGEITNYTYLKRIGEIGKKVLLSTGMSSLNEIKEAVKVLKDNGTKNITLLHCNSEYPTPFKDVNLKAILTMSKEMNLNVGYSDHTKGIEVSIAAVAIGATVIEKHFTLDRNMPGPDHKASLEPYELRKMIECIRNIELALGNGIKKPSESEIKNINVVRKSIVAKTNIKKGEKFTKENITCKRPGNGISPMRWNEILGQIALRDFEEDELIEI